MMVWLNYSGNLATLQKTCDLKEAYVWILIPESPVRKQHFKMLKPRDFTEGQNNPVLCSYNYSCKL